MQIIPQKSTPSLLVKNPSLNHLDCYYCFILSHQYQNQEKMIQKDPPEVSPLHRSGNPSSPFLADHRPPFLAATDAWPRDECNSEEFPSLPTQQGNILGDKTVFQAVCADSFSNRRPSNLSVSRPKKTPFATSTRGASRAAVQARLLADGKSRRVVGAVPTTRRQAVEAKDLVSRPRKTASLFKDQASACPPLNTPPHSQRRAASSGSGRACRGRTRRG